MSEIKEIKDRLREEIKEIDGKYAAVGKHMGKSGAYLYNLLNYEYRVPKLKTLLAIKEGVRLARQEQEELVKKLLS